jgi:hypothetical protein
MLRRGLAKPKQLIKRSSFSSSQLLLFVLVFGLVGGYVLYKSFAAGPVIASLQAEQMVLPAGGSVITDTAASGGKAIALLSNGSATGSVSLPSSADSLTITARGSQCQGAPLMSVSIDGVSVLSSLAVSSSGWSSYAATKTLGSGSHSVTISFSGDYTKTKGRKACDRNLYVDVTTLYGPVAVPTPAPTVALSASPTSLAAGSAATLTWNSTNASSCTASGAWSGTQPTSGSVSTGALNTNSTYSLTCTGPGGSASASATVTVTAASGTGYTDAASVDTSRMPAMPQSSTVINVTSPITISTAMHDVTYNVTGSMTSSTAVTLTDTGSLERVVVKLNGLAMNGVSGGTVKDVSVSGAKYAGFLNIKHYVGVNYGTGNNIDFYLNGSGVKMDADAMIKSLNTVNFGVMGDNLSSSSFDGAIVVLGAGSIADATNFECWEACSNVTFNVIVSNKATGYGLAIYRSDHVTVNDYLANGNIGTADSDPGISIGGGSHDNWIKKATVNKSSIGLIFGEDVDPPPYSNRVDNLVVNVAPYGGIVMDRGAYNNVVGQVGGVKLTDSGGAGLCCGYLQNAAIYISNRSGQINTPPHGNQVLGLIENGTGAWTPTYAVYLGAGTTGNTISGTASSWSLGKLYNGGSGNTLNL